MRFAEFEADFETGRLVRQGVAVPIQRQPFEALRILLVAQGRPVTRGELQRELWPEAVHVDFERGLTSAMHKVREALADAGRTPRLVETLPGRGYRFTGHIEFIDVMARVPTATTWWPNSAAALCLGLVLGVTAGGPWLVAPAPPLTAAENAWTVATQLHRTGRHGAIREAVRWFDQASQLDPGFADALAGAAEARVDLMARGEAETQEITSEARGLAARALHIDPRSPRARVVLARLELRADRLEAATNLLEATIADHPAFAPAYTALAFVRKQQGRAVDAASLANTALALAPDDAMTMALAGFYAHPLRQYERELELLERAARIDPASSDVLWHLALGHARRSNYEPALATLGRALRLSPDSPRLLYWRGYVEAEAGQISQARRTLDTLKRLTGGGTLDNRVVAALAWIIQSKGTGRS